MAIEKYSQCLLRRGNTIDIVWIETEFAITDRPIKVKFDGKWQEGWKVDAVYATHTAEFVELHARDHMLMATYQ